MAKRKEADFAGIGASLAGIFVPVVLFVTLFARESAWVLAPIAAAFAAMGIALGYFASKRR
ncbi:MAG: hypothetical protein QW548_03565 [Candidatus Aenigmatarchaeota archaeon]